MKVRVIPFHVAPSCLASKSYLVNINSAHSMLMGREREGRRKYLTVIVYLVILLLKNG